MSKANSTRGKWENIIDYLWAKKAIMDQCTNPIELQAHRNKMYDFLETTYYISWHQKTINKRFKNDTKQTYIHRA